MRGREAELDAALEPAVARRLQSRGATTALALPIGGTSGAVGVLEILRAGPDPFSDSERQLLRHVAAQAALALSRAGGGVETGLPELLDIAGEALSAHERRRGRRARRRAGSRAAPVGPTARSCTRSRRTACTCSPASARGSPIRSGRARSMRWRWRRCATTTRS